MNGCDAVGESCNERLSFGTTGSRAAGSLGETQRKEGRFNYNPQKKDVANRSQENRDCATCEMGKVEETAEVGMMGEALRRAGVCQPALPLRT
jgi:hypothetical protein